MGDYSGFSPNGKGFQADLGITVDGRASQMLE